MTIIVTGNGHTDIAHELCGHHTNPDGKLSDIAVSADLSIPRADLLGAEGNG